MSNHAVITVATDLQSLSGPALEAAARFARRFEARKVVLVHGVKSGGALSALRDGETRAFESARARMEAITADFGGAEVIRTVRSGPPARVVVEAADEHDAGIIVVSSHGYGSLRRAVLGSVANAIVRAAHCPVLVVGPDRPGTGPVEQITAAVDFSAVTDRVVRSAVHFAAAFQAPVRVVSVFEAAGLLVSDAGDVETGVTKAEVDALRARRVEELQSLEALAEGRVAIHTELLDGVSPPDVLLRETEQTAPSLLVIGTSGHDGWHRIVLGSTADQVLSEAKCPVLVIPSESPPL